MNISVIGLLDTVKNKCMCNVCDGGIPEHAIEVVNLIDHDTQIQQFHIRFSKTSEVCISLFTCNVE